MPDDELVDEVRKRLMRVSQATRRDSAGLAVTPAQGAVLSLLRGGPLTVGELARAEGLRPPTMTQMLHRMAAAGWVERREGAGRGRLVRITAAGRRVAERVRADRNALLADRMASLTPDERAALAAALPALDAMFGAPVVDRPDEPDAPDRQEASR